MAIFIEDPPSKGSLKGLRPYRGVENFCHLTADSETELMAYVESKGIPSYYCNKKVEWDFHFDIRGNILSEVQSDPEVLKLSWEDYSDRVDSRRKVKSTK